MTEPAGRHDAPPLTGRAPDLEAARRHALAVAVDLEKELAAIAESTEASPDDEHDAEGSTVGYERARVRGLLQSARGRLAELDRAIARSREGLAARCEHCGAPIDPERLAALPGTGRCAACARLAGLAAGTAWRRLPPRPSRSPKPQK